MLAHCNLDLGLRIIWNGEIVGVSSEDKLHSLKIFYVLLIYNKMVLSILWVGIPRTNLKMDF